jgi:hypothetical protein
MWGWKFWAAEPTPGRVSGRWRLCWAWIFSLRQERYDLLVTRERFFDQGIQYFLSLVHEKAFLQAAERLEGYDVSKSGKMIFSHELESEAELKSFLKATKDPGKPVDIPTT